jgi:hypothetical protein
MDLQSRKLSFIQEVLNIQNEDIIRGLEALLKKKKSEMYDEPLRPMSLDSLLDDVQLSRDDASNDRIISAKDLQEEIKTWS